MTKLSRNATIAGTVILLLSLGGAAWLKFRAKPLSSAQTTTEAASTETSKSVDSEAAKPADQTVTTAASAPIQLPMDEKSATLSHQDLVAAYEGLDDGELKSAIAAVDKDMEDKKLIDKANRGEISEEESAELKVLLKKFTALKEVETLRLLAADQ